MQNPMRRADDTIYPSAYPSLDCVDKLATRLETGAMRLLTIISRQDAFSNVIWSDTERSRKLGIFLANSTTLTIPSELSSCTFSQPGLAISEPRELLGVPGLLRAASESMVVVSGLGLLSADSPVAFEHVLGTGDAPIGLGQDEPFYKRERKSALMDRTISQSHIRI